MKILIIRHGEPDNPNKTLTCNGFKEVVALSNYLKDLKFKEAYSSPLERALLTAEGVLLPRKRKPIVLSWLKEFSHFVDVPYKEEKNINWDFLPSFFTAQDDFYNNDKYLKTETMQSAEVEKYYQEVVSEFDKLLLNYGYSRKGRYYEVNNANKDTIIIFCHFGMMSVLLSHLMNVPYVVLAQHFICQPTGITTLVTEEREEGIAQFRCLEYGSITHLFEAGIEPSFHGRFCETFDSNERH